MHWFLIYCQWGVPMPRPTTNSAGQAGETRLPCCQHDRRWTDMPVDFALWRQQKRTVIMILWPNLYMSLLNQQSICGRLSASAIVLRTEVDAHRPGQCAFKMFMHYWLKCACVCVTHVCACVCECVCVCVCMCACMCVCVCVCVCVIENIVGNAATVNLCNNYLRFAENWHVGRGEGGEGAGGER